MDNVFSLDFSDFSDIHELLAMMGAEKVFAKQKKIVLKPNLVSNLPYPVTTDPRVAEEFIKFIQQHSTAELIVAESSMDDTERNYKELGYTKLRDKYGISLVDLNYADVVILKNPLARTLKTFHLPKILEGSFLISLANLKCHHSEAKVTLSLKNMFGIAPGKYYGTSLRDKPWTKEMLHDLGVNNCIIDINTYCLPDMGFVDGRTAQLSAELGGPTKKHGRIYASFDPIALDAYCAKILGFNPRQIEYIEVLSDIYPFPKQKAHDF